MKNRFKYFLNEREEIGLAKKTFVALSSEAKNAIDEWERSGWETGRLVQSLNKKDSIAEEIYQAFMPIREFMKKKYGSKITLYRGIILDNTSKARGCSVSLATSINRSKLSRPLSISS